MMYEKLFDTVASNVKEVFCQMSTLRIHHITVKKDQRLDERYSTVYSIDFNDTKNKVNGTIHLGFKDIGCASSVALSIAEKMKSVEFSDNDDDLLIEFLNTAVGAVITDWDKMGYSASFEPTRVSQDIALNTQRCGSVSAVFIMALDVSQLFLKVVFNDTRFDALIGKKILIVDDSLMIRKLLSKKLTEIGFNVEVAHDGSEAIEKHRDFKPDLTIMDQVMPKLKGLDAIFEIEQSYPDAKFIMLTSTCREDEVNTAGTLNVIKYLVKPVCLTDLYKEISEALINGD